MPMLFPDEIYEIVPFSQLRKGDTIFYLGRQRLMGTDVRSEDDIPPPEKMDTLVPRLIRHFPAKGDPRCMLCDWSDREDPGWFHEVTRRTFMPGRGSESEDGLLCGFCYVSLAASKFLAGGQATTAEHDQLAIANLLRAEIRRSR